MTAPCPQGSKRRHRAGKPHPGCQGPQQSAGALPQAFRLHPARTHSVNAPDPAGGHLANCKNSNRFEQSNGGTKIRSPMRCKVSGPCGTLVEFLDRDVAVPHVVAVVLQADVALFLVAAAVQQQVVGFLVLILAELALVRGGTPARSRRSGSARRYPCKP